MLAADARTSALDTVEGRVGALAAAVEELAVPARLGDFEIVGELGRGGMGVVYEAQQREPARRVALKTLRVELSEGALEQFRVEAQAMATLLHPGIPQIYEIFEHEGRPALVMELGAEAVFVGSGIFHSEDPARTAAAIVRATARHADAESVARAQRETGAAMAGVAAAALPQEELLAVRGW